MPNLGLNSVIVMDNAPYHSRKNVSLCLRGRRADVIQQLQDVGFFNFLAGRKLPSVPNEMTLTLIFALCREYRYHFDEYFVDELAKQHGHTVLRSPPYHCILNPIEMLRAYQKRLVRSQSTVRTVKEAMTQCQQRFQQIPGPDFGRCFAHAQAEEERFWRLDGLADIPIPAIVIPVYDSETDYLDDNADSDRFSDDEDEIEY